MESGRPASGVGMRGARALEERGIESAIRVRKNSSRRARGCLARKRIVMEQLEEPEMWKP